MAYFALKASETKVFESDRSSEDRLGSLMFIRSILSWSRRWRQRAQDRRYLSELDDHVLSDIGLTRWDVTRETARPFWQPLNLRS
ncbi:uncharacterized protein YjiS (DUF1127 family) [Mesorhizobium sp. J18]|nr:uncharacterized protein YjiS (DUF1127 family) [Mesorhizobium sp. J18]